MTRIKHPWFISTIALVFITILIYSCAVNPVSGKKELMLMSEQEEIALGKQSDPSIVAQFGLYQDEEMQKFIDEKGKKMATISHRANLDYEFKILDSPVINAFAVPGGYVYFTRGIMAHFSNEAEFAGVLGHEIGHISARHSAKQYSKSMIAQIGFVVGVIASPTFRQFADVAQQSLGLLFLKFSRDNESQSDELGVEYSTKIGYDAGKMAYFFKTLDRMHSQNEAGQLPDFLSTHPNPADRFERVGRLAESWQEQYPASKKIERNNYLSMIDGLVYGEDPRQGYIQNNVFYHPELFFQFPIPSSWKTVNSPIQVQMAPSDGKALMFLTIAQSKNLQEAAQEVRDQYKLTPVETRNTSVNGLTAMALVSDQTSQNQQTGQEQTIRIQSYLIDYNNLIYVFHGMALLADYPSYRAYFNQTMKGFRKLTDQSKINVKPERIKIQTLNRNMTLGEAFQNYNVPSNRWEELAIVNSQELSDQLSQGTMIKILTE